jgi:hypothetical protein
MLLALPVAAASFTGQLQVAQATTGADEITWNLIRDSADPLVFEKFIEQFPDSPYARDAQSKIDVLTSGGIDIEPTPLPPPVPVSSEPSSEPPPPAPVDYSLDVQRELKRVGCYTGGLDGDWGSGSRRALTRFNERTGKSLGTEPTATVLAEVQATRSRVCPAATPSPPRPDPTPEPRESCFNFNGQSFCE